MNVLKKKVMKKGTGLNLFEGDNEIKINYINRNKDNIVFHQTNNTLFTFI